ncbi:LacI family transcriptional regulator [Georgenia sp. TF02-10]|uniref:LacI family DNA-binding transcriptional regulator n=1 Tax=Georgenia sp. TF02-10 TaxID=2917725 RepID=UPI001FA717DD|nr:LacI family DNA-binding transcriptional regulator [Georgenia sp. TF02-10]UNX54028.1 LacI family transcriptional regulator [Georgenia sp. TF02-10]
MSGRVTIKDVAAQAGVSRQTVTRALNGMDEISETTRAKVLEASERLGYRASRFASNLARSDKSRAIGFVVATFRNPFYTELTADLLGAASTRGWQVTVVSHEQASEAETLANVAREVDAIVGYFSLPDDEILQAARGVPVVLLARTPTVPNLWSVDIDFSAGIADLVGQLRQRGSKRFGMLESQLRGGPYVKSGRRAAYETHVDDRSREAVVICEAEYQSVDAGSAGFRRLMAEHPETDTVLAFSDLMAMGALAAAHEEGMQVPGQVRIVGIDGLSLGAVTYPALSTLAIPGDEIASNVADIIEAVLTGSAPNPPHRLVTPRPLWRGTG